MAFIFTPASDEQKAKAAARLALPRVWLQEHGFDPDGDVCKPGRRRTAMCEACHWGDLEMCKWLFEHGAAPTIRTKSSEGWTPMMYACSRGRLLAAKWLCGAGAAEDIRTTDPYGTAPIWEACRRGHLNVATWLFEVGADVRAKDREGRSLFFAACLEGRLLVAKWLFEVCSAAEDLHTKDNYENTPFFMACSRNHQHVARWLIEVGAAEDIQTENANQMTPLGEALFFRKLSLVAWLVLQGAACGADGHVQRALIAPQARPGFGWPALRLRFTTLLNRQSAFVFFLLSIASPTPVAGTPVAAAAASPLALLRGHEATLLPLVAEFAGVLRGRKLRIAREIERML